MAVNQTELQPNAQPAQTAALPLDMAMPIAGPASQSLMPTADNPTAVPLFGQVGVNQGFTLGALGQQGATAAAPQRYDNVKVPQGRGSFRYENRPSATGAYVATGRPNEYLPASAIGNRTSKPMGDMRVGLQRNDFQRGDDSMFVNPTDANASFVPGTNSIPGLGSRRADRRMMNPRIPAYAEGGVIGQPPNGQPGLQPQGYEGAPIDAKLADAHITDMLTRNPQVKQQIQQAIQQAIQSGELNPQMAQMAVQLAQASIQNPALYPQLRQFAIQRGLAEPTELPEQYDQGLVMVILIAAKAAMGMGTSQQPQQPGQQLTQGGMIQGPGTGTSDSITAQNTSDGSQVKVSNGEYVVPAAVVAAKGRDFFDALVRKYAEVPR